MVSSADRESLGGTLTATPYEPEGYYSKGQQAQGSWFGRCWRKTRDQGDMHSERRGDVGLAIVLPGVEPAIIVDSPDSGVGRETEDTAVAGHDSVSSGILYIPLHGVSGTTIHYPRCARRNIRDLRDWRRELQLEARKAVRGAGIRVEADVGDRVLPQLASTGLAVVYIQVDQDIAAKVRVIECGNQACFRTERKQQAEHGRGCGDKAPQRSPISIHLSASKSQVSYGRLPYSGRSNARKATFTSDTHSTCQ